MQWELPVACSLMVDVVGFIVVDGTGSSDVDSEAVDLDDKMEVVQVVDSFKGDDDSTDECCPEGVVVLEVVSGFSCVVFCCIVVRSTSDNVVVFEVVSISESVVIVVEWEVCVTVVSCVESVKKGALVVFVCVEIDEGSISVVIFVDSEVVVTTGGVVSLMGEVAVIDEPVDIDDVDVDTNDASVDVDGFMDVGRLVVCSLQAPITIDCSIDH